LKLQTRIKSLGVHGSQRAQDDRARPRVGIVKADRIEAGKSALARSMQGDWFLLDSLCLQTELRCLAITDIADDHIQQQDTVVFTDDTVRRAHPDFAAAVACIEQHSHGGFKRARHVPGGIG
jgi:hypothetical protein